jgi:DNA-binding transcriptional LysR family regulator
MLNFLEIQIFAVAAETENFSQTARRLHLSQPAVSQRIHSLERHLGLRLFRRSGRSVELTNAGRVLLPMALELLEKTRQIEETMWDLEGEVAGHVTIGCTTTAGKYALPLLAAEFSRHYPDVQVTIEMPQCSSAEDPLLSQDVHLSISNHRIVHRDIECQPFFTDQLILIVPADHPFSVRSSVRPLELLDQRFILREEGGSTNRMLGEKLGEHQIHLDQLHVVMYVGNSEAIGLAVEHGLGIAFISRLAAVHGIRSGKLVEVPVDGLHLERQLYVVRNTSCPKTPAEAALWEFVGEHRETIAHLLDS